jgi:hypothetical protein
MNNMVFKLPPQGGPLQECKGLELLLLAAGVLIDADPMVGLALRAGLYFCQRYVLQAQG